MPTEGREPGVRRKAGLAALLALALVLGACGITAPRSGSGYAELGSLGVFDTDRTFSLSLGPSLLHFAARHIDDDPETRALLEQLDGVRIYIYEIDGDPLRVAGRLEQMSRRLGEAGWEPVVLVREEGEETHLLVKSERGRICGLTLLSSDGESEAVVINLIGNIRPENFGEVMVALDVDVPGVADVRPAEVAN